MVYGRYKIDITIVMYLTEVLRLIHRFTDAHHLPVATGERPQGSRKSAAAEASHHADRGFHPPEMLYDH